MVDDEVVVVGSGPTGAIAAWTLVNAGCHVTLLESGNSFPKAPHLRWDNREIRRPFSLGVWGHAPYPYFENLDDILTRWIKVHLLGGLGSFWHGNVLRFAPQDFTLGEAISESFRWPISYLDLEPFYQQVEQLLHVRGGQTSVPVLPACQVSQTRQVPKEMNDLTEAAQQLNRWLVPLNDAYGKPNIFSLIPSPSNISVRLIQQLQRRRNFRLISNAHVTRVIFQKQNSLANGIEYVDRKTGQFFTQPAKSVMLAAGQLGSTHILLNSSASQGDIGNSYGLIGRYLHDNPMGVYSYKVDKPFPALTYITGGLYLTRAQYSEEGPLGATGFQIYGGIPLASYKNIRTNLQIDPQQLKDEGCSLIFACYGTQTPDESRCISLHPEVKDEYGLPLLRINTRNNQDDLALLSEGRHTTEALLKTAGWKFFPESASVEPPGTAVHFGGTARMHSNPKFGVVDAYNRMHEIANVFVVDASCFTTSVEKNPTLTAMAIAMRAAYYLAKNRQISI